MSQDIICSGALFYSLKTKRFLFLHRVQSKQNNVWGLVGGTNNSKETPWESLQREIKEVHLHQKLRNTVLRNQTFEIQETKISSLMNWKRFVKWMV